MGKGNEQTTKQKTEPWKPAQPYLKQILREGSDLYDQGSTFVPADRLQEDYFQGVEDLARQGNPLLPSVLGNAENVLAGGGMSDRQREVQSALMPYATGQYLGGGNPYLEGILDRTATDTSERVRSEMAGLGRTGSGAHQGILSDSLADSSNRLRYQDYNQQVQNQMSAAGQVFGMGDTAAQRALGYSALAPGMDAMRYGDVNRLGQVGAQRRGIGQEEAMAPWSDLSRYAGLISGTAAPYSTTTQTVSGGTDPLSTILGGLLTVGSFGMPGGGSLGGALLGGLSDERAKTDIKKVGKLDDTGVDVVSFKYKGSPQTVLGVLAGDMQKKKPDAVHVYNDMKYVDYSKV